MMKLTPCKKCGNKLSPRAIFCPKCGVAKEAKRVEVPRGSQSNAATSSDDELSVAEFLLFLITLILGIGLVPTLLPEIEALLPGFHFYVAAILSIVALVLFHDLILNNLFPNGGRVWDISGSALLMLGGVVVFGAIYKGLVVDVFDNDSVWVRHALTNLGVSILEEPLIAGVSLPENSTDRLPRKTAAATRKKTVGCVKGDCDHGVGTYVFGGGARYEGQYRNKKPHGRGVYYFPEGDRYEGEFLDGKRHGIGTYFYPSGSRYVGSFAYGTKQGKGTEYYSDGTSLSGDWMGGAYQGSSSTKVAAKIATPSPKKPPQRLVKARTYEYVDHRPPGAASRPRVSANQFNGGSPSIVQNMEGNIAALRQLSASINQPKVYPSSVGSSSYSNKGSKKKSRKYASNSSSSKSPSVSSKQAGGTNTSQATSTHFAYLKCTIWYGPEFPVAKAGIVLSPIHEFKVPRNDRGMINHSLVNQKVRNLKAGLESRILRNSLTFNSWPNKRDKGHACTEERTDTREAANERRKAISDEQRNVFKALLYFSDERCDNCLN